MRTECGCGLGADADWVRMRTGADFDWVRMYIGCGLSDVLSMSISDNNL